jgi:hypothetical protein
MDQYFTVALGCPTRLESGFLDLQKSGIVGSMWCWSMLFFFFLQLQVPTLSKLSRMELLSKEHKGLYMQQKSMLDL